MSSTILKRKSYYALGLTIAILGFILLLVVVWRWWDMGVFSSSNIISAINSSFGTEDPVLGLGMGLTLFPYTILSIAFIVVGSVILVLRKEKVTVTEEVTVLLECPICKHQW